MRKNELNNVCEATIYNGKRTGVHEQKKQCVKTIDLHCVMARERGAVLAALLQDWARDFLSIFRAACRAVEGIGFMQEARIPKSCGPVPCG